jgi:hypothetical protein
MIFFVRLCEILCATLWLKNLRESAFYLSAKIPSNLIWQIPAYAGMTGLSA